MIRVLAAGVACVLIMVGAPSQVIASAVGLAVSPIVAALVGILFVGDHLLRERRRSEEPDTEQRFLSELAASVRAGADLRSAIHGSPSEMVTPAARRLCDLGAPMREVGSAVAASLPGTGRGFVAVAAVSERAGASISQALSMLAQHAAGRVQDRRDAKVALAQAKLSTVVVGLVPLAIGCAVLLLRGVPEPGGAAVVIPMVTGALMMATGAGVVLLVSRRVARW